ncbi:hypothetical protein KVT40_002439 [Elsinoe batatas]|uniref:Uncharacterized protein n=1 Tax=Elsinoe batatas TaxID=2601811 RepID=A0A8K0LB35_9PEZI|nr:hypothetical protein KVT40_002439 [Elsinoe batatas]
MADKNFEQWEKDRLTSIDSKFLSYAVLHFNDLNFINKDVWRVDEVEVQLIVSELSQNGFLSRWLPEHYIIATVDTYECDRIPQRCKFSHLQDRPATEPNMNVERAIGTQKYMVTVQRGQERIEACSSSLPKEHQWWVFSLYSDSLSTEDVNYLTKRRLRQSNLPQGQILRELCLSQINGDKDDRKFIERSLVKTTTRARYAQLLGTKCAISARVITLLKNEALVTLFEDAPLGALNWVLPSKFHEQMNKYLDLVHVIWTKIAEISGNPTRQTVQKLSGLVPKHSSEHRDVIEEWLDEVGMEGNKKEVLQHYLFAVDKIVTFATFLADVRQLYECQKILLSVAPKRFMKGQSLLGAYLEMSSLDDGVYSKWCEMLLSCIRYVYHCNSITGGKCVTNSSIQRFRTIAHKLGFDKLPSPSAGVMEPITYLGMNEDLDLSQDEAWGCEQSVKRTNRSGAKSTQVVKAPRRKSGTPRVSFGEALSHHTAGDWTSSLLLTRMFLSDIEGEPRNHVSPLGVVIATMSCFLDQKAIKAERAVQKRMYDGLKSMNISPSAVEDQMSAIWRKLRHASLFHRVENRTKMLCRNGADIDEVVESITNDFTVVSLRPLPVEAQSKHPLRDDDDIDMHTQSQDMTGAATHAQECLRRKGSNVDDGELVATRYQASCDALREQIKTLSLTKANLESSVEELERQVQVLEGEVKSATRDKNTLQDEIGGKMVTLQELSNQLRNMRSLPSGSRIVKRDKRKLDCDNDDDYNNVEHPRFRRRLGD